MVWISEHESREAMLSELPAIAGHFDALYRQFWQLPQLPARNLELVRLRLAQLHGCDHEWQRKELILDKADRDDLSRWPGSDRFSEGEKACLGFAEVYAMDVQAITDEQAAAVKAVYGDAGLVALIEALGILDGMTRLSLLWDLPAAAHE